MQAEDSASNRGRPRPSRGRRSACGSGTTAGLDRRLVAGLGARRVLHEEGGPAEGGALLRARGVEGLVRGLAGLQGEAPGTGSRGGRAGWGRTQHRAVPVPVHQRRHHHRAERHREEHGDDGSRHPEDPLPRRTGPNHGELAEGGLEERRECGWAVQRSRRLSPLRSPMVADPWAPGGDHASALHLLAGDDTRTGDREDRRGRRAQQPAHPIVGPAPIERSPDEGPDQPEHHEGPLHRGAGRDQDDAVVGGSGGRSGRGATAEVLERPESVGSKASSTLLMQAQRASPQRRHGIP